MSHLWPREVYIGRIAIFPCIMLFACLAAGGIWKQWQEEQEAKQRNDPLFDVEVDSSEAVASPDGGRIN